MINPWCIEHFGSAEVKVVSANFTLTRILTHLRKTLGNLSKTAEDDDGNVGKTIRLKAHVNMWNKADIRAVLLSNETSTAPFPCCLQNAADKTYMVTKVKMYFAKYEVYVWRNIFSCLWRWRRHPLFLKFPIILCKVKQGTLTTVWVLMNVNSYYTQTLNPLHNLNESLFVFFRKQHETTGNIPPSMSGSCASCVGHNMYLFAGHSNVGPTSNVSFKLMAEFLE